MQRLEGFADVVDHLPDLLLYEALVFFLVLFYLLREVAVF